MSYADVADPVAALNNAENLQGGPTVEEAIADAGVQVQVVNWIWEKVVGDDLVETLIAPITGDFEKIAATGKQWSNVCDALQAVRDNLNGGLSELDPHWDGDAAQGFSRLISTVWTVGIEADAQAAKLIGAAFAKVAEASKTACEKALDLIRKLVNKLLEAIALLPIPVVGWGKAVKTVIDAIEIFNAVVQIIDGIKQIIEGATTIIQGIRDLGTAISRIRDVRDVNGALNAANDVGDSVATVNDGREQVGAGAGGVRDGAASAGRNGANANEHYNQYRAERTPPAPAPEPVGAGSGTGSGGGGGGGGSW